MSRGPRIVLIETAAGPAIRCRMCGILKDATEFYAQPGAAWGRRASCKPCYLADQQARRARQRQAVAS